MKKYLVCYATKEFFKSQKRLIDSALKFGIDDYFAYSPKDIDKKFKKDNKNILSCKRGGGYWLWKPYVILEAMKRVDDGDLVVYLDSGIEVIDDLTPLFNLCIKKGLLLFYSHDYKNKGWVKRDCFVIMGCDSEIYHNSDELAGGIQLYLKNNFNLQFVTEYLDYCKNINIISDIPNICGKANLPEFIDHRHDQSVLSLLAIKKNIEIFRDPSQYGNHYKTKEYRKEGEYLDLGKIYSKAPFINSLYGTIFDHHRERIIKKNLLVKIFLKLKNKIKKLKEKNFGKQ